MPHRLRRASDYSFDVLVIGGGIAGIEAALTAKSIYSPASVAIISHKPLTYPRPDPGPVILKHIQHARQVERYGVEYIKSSKIKLFENYEAISVDHEYKIVNIKRHSNEKPFSIGYNSLIIATGSIPIGLPKSSNYLKGIFTLKWFDDALALSRYIKPRKKAHVIGAGVIGLEIAEALKERGLDVKVIEALPSILSSILEPDLSEPILRKMEIYGIKVLTQTTLEEVNGDKEVKYIVAGDQKKDADVVVIAIGMCPNSYLGQKIGLELADNQAIKTDKQMKTNFIDVYAVGDCAETIDYITGKSVYRPLGSIAAKTANIAGSNVAGEEKIYNGFLRMQYANLFGMVIESIGLTVKEAKSLGIQADTVRVSPNYPDYPFLSLTLPTNALMKIIIDKAKDTIIGWQSVGLHGAQALMSWSSQLFLDLIEKKQNLSDLQEMGNYKILEH